MPRADGYFNTSNVTIQPISLAFVPSGRVISIHLMLLFNVLRNTKAPAILIFQYI